MTRAWRAWARSVLAPRPSVNPRFGYELTRKICSAAWGASVREWTT
jgi:hypothetical protein